VFVNTVSPKLLISYQQFTSVFYSIEYKTVELMNSMLYMLLNFITAFSTTKIWKPDHALFIKAKFDQMATKDKN
jgi:hypothetical protein